MDDSREGQRLLTETRADTCLGAHRVGHGVDQDELLVVEERGELAVLLGDDEGRERRVREMLSRPKPFRTGRSKTTTRHDGNNND